MPYITMPATVNQGADIFKISIRAIRIESEGRDLTDATRKLRDQLSLTLSYLFSKDSIKVYQTTDNHWTFSSTECDVLLKRVFEISPLPKKEGILDRHKKVERATHLKSI